VTDFYRSSFGDVRLWISKISTDKSRDLVVHDPSAGDNHPVQDRGRALLRAQVTVLFDYMIGDDLAPLDRLLEFKRLVDDKPRMFAHPVEGSYLARVGRFNYEIDGSGVITADVEFVQVADVAPVVSGGTTSAGGGAAGVAAAAAATDAELAAIGGSSSLPTSCATTADGWESTDAPNARDVLVDTGALTSQLGVLASSYESDLQAWTAYKSIILLSDTLAGAAVGAMSSSATTFTIRVGAAIALRALVASVYGAGEADDRYAQVLLLNDIANPAWIEIGTELQMPAPATAARSA
jgi:hypothetical protein